MSDVLPTPDSEPDIIPEAEVSPHQVVLLLVGLVGSGKSTFAQALEGHVPHFRRCNQDDLGDRHAVEELARRTLAEGLSVCIDRTNFDERQRATWINIAREFPGTQVWVLVFDTPYEVCAERLRHRTDHPTIKTPDVGLSVLARFASQFRAPTPHEGYQRLLALRPADHPAPEYTREDVLAILRRVRDAPPPEAGEPNQYAPRGGYHTNSRRGGGYRGQGYNGSRGHSGRGSWTSYNGGSRGYGSRGGSYGQQYDYDNNSGTRSDDQQSWRSRP